MEYQRLTQAFLTENAALQQGRSLVARLGEVDFPVNGFATVNILNQVQIVILATHWRGQVGEVSRPREFHSQPLAERCVNLSAHTAPIKQTHPTFLATNAQTNWVAL